MRAYVLDQIKQRVVVDGYRTEYVFVNRGVPQGTVLGPVLFSIFINDIKAVNTNKNLLVKFADDITVSLPIEANVALMSLKRKSYPLLNGPRTTA